MNEPKHGAWPGREIGHGLGFRLKAVREDLSLSQAELARRLGLSKSSIAKYETGVHIPTVPILVRLAQGLRVSADYLVGLVAAAAPELGDEEDLAEHLKELALLDKTARACVVPVFGAMVKVCRRMQERREQARR